MKTTEPVAAVDGTGVVAAAAPDLIQNNALMDNDKSGSISLQEFKAKSKFL